GAALAALVAEREIRLASRTRFGHGSGPRDDEVGASDLLARLDELEAVGPRPSHGSLRHAGLDGRAVRTVIEAKRQLERALRRRDVEVEPGFDEEEALLVATLAGFPDRVARRRKEGGRELALAGGGATLDEASVVKDAALMVAVEAQEHAGRTFVRQASAVSLEHLMELFLDRHEDHVGARFDPKLERIFGVRELTFDGLVVERGDAEIDDATAAQALATAALQKGVGRFCDADALEALTLRLRFAREHDERLPTIDDAWLEALLEKLCAGRRSFAELRDAGLLDWIRAELTPHRARLDALAPEHVAIPGRARVPVTYEVDRPPWIASRLQDFFSAAEGPKVADGRQPLVLHLLAPNRRAVQVTTDLAGFWERHYPEIQRELRRRYPRHAWPDDPLSAPPSRPGRGRGRR
ncbi:MAG: ATP-dependent helicase C-terminal domain-containing protein, partial [Sandaracinaceae bacterium]